MPYNARQVSVLQAERTNDPLSRSYSAMSDVQFQTSIITVDRPNPLTLMSAGDIFEAIVPSEFQGLTNSEQTRVDRILGLGAEIIIGPGNSPNAVQELLNTFGVLSTTVTNLSALRDQQQSRAQEIGLPDPILADVQRTS